MLCRCAIFNRAVNCFFHLVRRFWNQVFICTSVKFNVFDNSIRLLTLKYLSCLNSFSNFSNCLTLYACRGFRSIPCFRDRFPNNFGPATKMCLKIQWNEKKISPKRDSFEYNNKTKEKENENFSELGACYWESQTNGDLMLNSVIVYLLLLLL